MKSSIAVYLLITVSFSWNRDPSRAELHTGLHHVNLQRKLIHVTDPHALKHMRTQTNTYAL